MTTQQRNIRNSKVIQYKLIDKHTAEQTAKKFNLSINQVFIILRKYKNGKF